MASPELRADPGLLGQEVYPRNWWIVAHASAIVSTTPLPGSLPRNTQPSLPISSKISPRPGLRDPGALQLAIKFILRLLRPVTVNRGEIQAPR